MRYAALVGLAFITVSCGSVATYNDEINEPATVDTIEPVTRGTQVQIEVDLGVCFYKDQQIPSGEYELHVGEGTTDIGVLPCRPFKVATANPPTAPTTIVMILPETK